MVPNRISISGQEQGMHILRGLSIEPLPYYEVINIINGNTSVPLSQAALNMTAGFRNCGGIQVAHLHNPLLLKFPLTTGNEKSILFLAWGINAGGKTISTGMFELFIFALVTHWDRFILSMVVHKRKRKILNFDRLPTPSFHHFNFNYGGWYWKFNLCRRLFNWDGNFLLGQNFRFPRIY
jgi:hypothetical protein